MSSGLQFMYGHMFGAQHRRPHIDTVKAIRRSTTQPFVTSPIGVPMERAQSNIHQGHAISRPAPAPAPVPAPSRTLVRTTARTRVPASVSRPPAPAPAPAPSPAASTSDIDDIIQLIQQDPALMSNLKERVKEEKNMIDNSPGQQLLQRLAKKYNQNIDG